MNLVENQKTPIGTKFRRNQKHQMSSICVIVIFLILSMSTLIDGRPTFLFNNIKIVNTHALHIVSTYL